MICPATSEPLGEGRWRHHCPVCRRSIVTHRPNLHRVCRARSGLGETVHAVLLRLGFRKKCGGCSKRQAWLNRIFPYHWPAWLRRLRAIVGLPLFILSAGRWG